MLHHLSSLSGHHKESGSLEPSRGQSQQFSCYIAVFIFLPFCVTTLSRDPGLGRVNILGPVSGPKKLQKYEIFTTHNKTWSVILQKGS